MSYQYNLDNLMLDAIRRGILFVRGIGIQNEPKNEINLSVLKKRICHDVGRLTREKKIQVLLAVVRVAGLEAIGVYNNGCMVDITKWSAPMTKNIAEIIQFASK
jgi:hypothetical protein